MLYNNKIKKLLLALLFGFALPCFSADVSPLYFEDYLNPSVRVPADSQQAFWDYLMKYKIFGQTEILFTNQEISIPDKSGWFGTATGDWILKNTKHHVGGPILIGGNVSFDDGSDTISTGPMRVLGNLITSNFNGPNYIVGHQCVQGSVQGDGLNNYNNAVPEEERFIGANYANCPITVPEVKTDMTIPILGEENPTYSAALSANNTTIYIDVPPGEGTADIYIESIRMENVSRLIIRMQNGGRNTRVFLRDGFYFTAHPKIQVQYMSNSAVFDEGTSSWSGTYSPVQNSSYSGNLLFYTDKDISFPALNSLDSIQGSFISRGTISIKQHMTLAGQLIANKISIDSDFDGSGFIFVPFDPPQIDPAALASGVYLERDTLEKIQVSLNKVPQTDVFFDFCFDFHKNLDENWDSNNPLPGYADATDLSDSTDLIQDMILCERNQSKVVTIPMGSMTPIKDEDNAWIRVKKDMIPEGDEVIYFCISNISGATIKGNYENRNQYVCLPIHLRDTGNELPVLYDNNTLNVSENVPGASAGKINAYDPDADGSVIEFKIIGGSGEDFFEITNNGEISLKAGVSVDYEKDQFFTLLVVAQDNTGAFSAGKTYVVTVNDVNENPTVEPNQVFEIMENSKTGDMVCTAQGVCKIARGDIDILNDLFRNNIVEAIGGDTKVFAVSSNGILSVLNGDSLDYEKRTEYSLEIRVRDVDNPSLFVETTIKINVLDDPNDGPKFDSTTVKVVVNEDSLFNLINLDKKKQGSVVENNDANEIVGSVIATCTDENKTLVYEIVKDESSLFEINPSTGVISVKDELVLDYEKINSYTIRVKVSDAIDVGNGKDANGVIVQKDERDVVIRIIDENEAPQIFDQQFVVFENEPIGALVGRTESTDPDIYNSNFMVSTYSLIDGDTTLFVVTQDGSILTKTILDYEEYAKTGDTLFTLVVVVKNVLDKTGTKYADDSNALADTASITIALRDVNEKPTIITEVISVKEHSDKGFVVDTLEAKDFDGKDILTFTLLEESEYFELSESGVVTVKEGANIDYEKFSSTTINVRVTDSEGAYDTKVILVNIEDINEPPTIKDQSFAFIESDSIGTIKGPILASDPDTKPEFSKLTYSLVGKSEKFEVLEDGKIKLKEKLDYEKDSIYVINVRVTDGMYADTAKVTIRIGNVIEYSEVKITRAENTDSLWLKPDTIFVNRDELNVCWTQGIKGDSKPKEFCADTLLKEGKNVITKTYKDSSTDFPGTATLIVYKSTFVPEVVISKADNPDFKTNIYTIVESDDKKESSTFFVNSSKNDIKISVKDSAANVTESFTVKLQLEDVSIPSTHYKTMKSISDAILPLNENAKETIHTPVNGEKIEVSYPEIVDGNNVIVTYYTDMEGNILKGESGKEEMIVIYSKTIDGKPVKISFVADAMTGHMIELKNKASYKISYDYVDSKKNSVNVAYEVNEDGKVIKNSQGNVGYEVSYTYKNKFGNSATRSLSIVLDVKPPLVWIKSPVTDQVLTSNMAEIEWYVSVTGDSADFVLQDSLAIQGLEKGANTIVRYFVDKAGNVASDTVYVIMKDAKDIEIAVEKPVTFVSRDKVDEYYNEDNRPKKGETFAVSIANPTTGDEKETLIGGDFKTKKGSGKVPYENKKGHLGPTLGIDVKLPVYSSVGGLATLDDLLGKDGKIPLEGVDAEGGEKLAVSDYVKKYCTAEFASSYDKGDLSSANLYNSSMQVKIWVFTTLGSFVDYYTFTQDLNDPDYVNDAGLLKMYFEMKPDKEGYVRTENGRLYATGAYIYKTEVEIKSHLSCTLPPVNDASNGQMMGSIRKTDESMTKSFGYKRPDYNKKK